VSAPQPTAVRKAGERIRRLLPLARAGGIRRSPWRARLPLFAVLAVLFVAATAVLIGYHAFYDERFKTLERTRTELAAKRDEAAEATRRVVKTEERLRALQRDLEVFNRDVLGGRKERLAAVIEDVYQLTEKAGTVPGQISYSFDEVGTATRLALSFNVQGRYADIKKLLFSFESNPRFLLLENVALATDDIQPDVLRLNLVVAHYFRPDASALPRRVTRAARRVDRTGAAQAGGPAATPAATPAAAPGVPE
jgi:Tfp pilus assembly protein PilO